MIGRPNTAIKIERVFKTAKRLQELVKAFELLYDQKPIIEVKGYFETHDGLHEHYTEYDEVSKVTTRSVYFKYHGNTAFIPNGEHCFVRLLKQSDPA